MPGHELLFTLTPKRGFYEGPNRAAYLDGCIICYHPSNVGPLDVDGYVYFTYQALHSPDENHVRLWSTAPGKHRLCAMFDIETTDVGAHDFQFSIAVPDQGFQLLKTVAIEGRKHESVMVEFPADVNGDALLGLKAMKNMPDAETWILRSISVHVMD